MVKRSCESATLPLASRFTFTTGKPGCSVQPAAISTTGLPDASAQRIPQISRGGVGIFVGLHVAPNSIAEDFFAQKAFQHAQKGLSFLVSDIVESAVGLGFGGDFLLDRMSCGADVAFHRLFLGDPNAPGRIAWNAFLQPDFPLRIEMSGAFRPHPGSKPFVEPKIVPPRHGDEITEPLWATSCAITS